MSQLGWNSSTAVPFCGAVSIDCHWHCWVITNPLRVAQRSSKQVRAEADTICEPDNPHMRYGWNDRAGLRPKVAAPMRLSGQMARFEFKGDGLTSVRWRRCSSGHGKRVHAPRDALNSIVA